MEITASTEQNTSQQWKMHLSGSHGVMVLFSEKGIRASIKGSIVKIKNVQISSVEIHTIDRRKSRLVINKVDDHPLMVDYVTTSKSGVVAQSILAYYSHGIAPDKVKLSKASETGKLTKVLIPLGALIIFALILLYHYQNRFDPSSHISRIELLVVEDDCAFYDVYLVDVRAWSDLSSSDHGKIAEYSILKCRDKVLHDGASYYWVMGWEPNGDLAFSWNGGNQIKYYEDGMASYEVYLTTSQTRDFPLPISDEPADASSFEDIEYAEPEVILPSDEPTTFDLGSDGSTVTSPFSLPAEIAMATFEHSGDSNFAVSFMTSDFENPELKINEIGKYKGTVLLVGNLDTEYRFEVTADSEWSATVSTILPASSPGLGGKGDSVSGMFAASGTEIYKFTHEGSSNFAVWLHTDNGSTLCVNTIGDYEGEMTVDFDGTVGLWEIKADGRWSIAKVRE